VPVPEAQERPGLKARRRILQALSDFTPCMTKRIATRQKMWCFFALTAKKDLLFGLFRLLKMRVQAIQPYRIRVTLME
jgi:hypothetical protein